MDSKKAKGKKPPPQRTKRKVTLLLSTAAIFIVVAVFLMSIDLIQIVSNIRSHIRNGSVIYQLLAKENPCLYVSTYLFNVTNAEEFLRGEDSKLKVEEVGPFTYLEIRSNLDMVVDEEAQSLHYSPKVRPVFQPDKSIADPRDINVTMPNIAMLAMSSMISSHGYFAKLGFSLLLSQLKSKALVNLNAEEFLWGYDEPLIRLGNQILPGWINFETMGIMDRLYNSSSEYRLEIATAVDEKFKIKKMNGLGGLKYWDYEDPDKRTACNTFTDVYEGIAYPNMMDPGAPLKLFRHVLCRFLELEYQGRFVTEHGADTLRYTVSKSNYQLNNSTDCLCGRGTCMYGISDLSPCYYNLPLVLSNAHFLDGDPKLLERVDGLNPSEEKHGSELLLEPKVGMVVKTSFSVQVNVAVNTVDFSEQLRRFSDMVVPLCYFKLTQPELNAYNLFYLKQMYVFVPRLLLAIKIVLISISIILAAYCLQILWPKLPYVKSRGISLRNSNEIKRPSNFVPLLGNK